jgi:hypothetical protein
VQTKQQRREQITVPINPDLRAGLGRVCAREHRTIASWVRRAPVMMLFRQGAWSALACPANPPWVASTPLQVQYGSGERAGAAMNRYGWTVVAYIAFCFLAPFYMRSGGPITAERLWLLGAMVAVLGAFVNLSLAYGAGRWIVDRLWRP